MPTFSETGLPGFTSGSWTMLLALAGTPVAIGERRCAEVAKLSRLPAYRERIDAMGIVPVGNTPEQANAFLKAEVARWGKIIRDANVQADN